MRCADEINRNKPKGACQRRDSDCVYRIVVNITFIFLILLHTLNDDMSEIHKNINKKHIHGGIRTHDLRIRSPARYPLRYADTHTFISKNQQLTK